jgi:hypothetical protein
MLERLGFRLVATLLVGILATLALFVGFSQSGNLGQEPEQQAVAPTATPWRPIVTNTPRPTSTSSVRRMPTPGPTATPVVAPAVQDAAFALEDAGGYLELFTAPSTDVHPYQPALLIFDIAARETMVWREIGGAPVELGERLTTFGTSNKGLSTGPAVSIGDNKTGKIYRWPGSAQVASIGGNHALFRIPDFEADDWFILVQFDAAGPHITRRFRTEGDAALLSDGGTRIAVWGEQLTLMEVSTGKVETVSTIGRGNLDDRGRISMRTTMEGNAFLVRLTAGSSKGESRWLHYWWDGSLIAQGTGKVIDVSHQGRLIMLNGPASPGTPSFYVRSTLTGDDVFRVIGVGEYLDYNYGSRFLADGSGLILMTAESELVRVMYDGRVLPFLGMPSPVNADLFADYGSIRDKDGAIVAQAFEPERAALSPIWSRDGREVRFITSGRCCHGPPWGIDMRVPSIQFPPYADPPVTQLDARLSGADLLDAPGNGNVVGRLNNLVVAAHESLSLSDFDDHPVGSERHCQFFETFERDIPCVGTTEEAAEHQIPLSGTWLRITTADGIEGWLLVRVTSLVL